MSTVIRKISEDTYQKMARTAHSLLEEERGTAETPKLDKLWDNGWDMRAAETVEGVLDQIKNGGIRNRVNWTVFKDEDEIDCGVARDRRAAKQEALEAVVADLQEQLDFAWEDIDSAQEGGSNASVLQLSRWYSNDVWKAFNEDRNPDEYVRTVDEYVVDCWMERPDDEFHPSADYDLMVSMPGGWGYGIEFEWTVNSHDWELRFVDDDRLFMIWGTVPPLAYGTADTPDYCLEEAVNWLAQDIHTMILEEVAAVNEKMDDGMSEVEAIGIHYDWIPRLRNAGWTDENLDTVDGVKDALWEGVFEPDDQKNIGQETYNTVVGIGISEYEGYLLGIRRDRPVGHS